jgi:FkbM family methyltransferase
MMMRGSLPLKTLGQFTTLLRAVGLRPINRFGRQAMKGLGLEKLYIDFAGLRMEGSVEDRLHLYQVAANQMEPFMSEQFLSAVRSRSVVLDLGSHLGYYTLLAAQAGARVYAFEPDPRTFQYLIRNISINGFSDRVVTVPKAVCGTSGIASFFANKRPTHSSLVDNSGEVDAITVKQIALDDFLDDNLVVDVIKMDIQGVELQALEGMERTIARASRDLVMFIECWPPGLSRAGGSAVVLLEKLSKLGFTVLVIDEEARCLAPAGPHIESVLYVNLLCKRGGC